MNTKYTKQLNQKVYYISFSHKRISEIMAWIEKNNPKEVSNLIKPADQKELANYHTILGILLANNIDKLGTKLVRNMKKQELRDKLAETIDKDDNIKKIFNKEKITKSDIVQSEGATIFDPIALLKIGFDLSVLKD